MFLNNTYNKLKKSNQKIIFKFKRLKNSKYVKNHRNSRKKFFFPKLLHDMLCQTKKFNMIVLILKFDLKLQLTNFCVIC
ncbi:hypothetical protein BpHYR1_038511 [Brachionus plicatilis]|uniref:Uncharacterized protein n=1 Tax=Brachionus plicatilis TaxID=10195 RepID=A0A3M7PDR1_BRAPC|nr:hypothetical protein BpHYR1_038511 [Brachionus plicatilis]